MADEKQHAKASAKADQVLAKAVCVQNPESGHSEWFQAGQTVPDWAHEAITNKAVFVDKDELDEQQIPVPGPSQSFFVGEDVTSA